MKIQISYSIGFGSQNETLEIDNEDLKDMDEETKNEYINKEVFELVSQRLDYGWTIKD